MNMVTNNKEFKTSNDFSLELETLNQKKLNLENKQMTLIAASGPFLTRYMSEDEEANHISQVSKNLVDVKSQLSKVEDDISKVQTAYQEFLDEQNLLWEQEFIDEGNRFAKLIEEKENEGINRLANIDVSDNNEAEKEEIKRLANIDVSDNNEAEKEEIKRLANIDVSDNNELNEVKYSAPDWLKNIDIEFDAFDIISQLNLKLPDLGLFTNKLDLGQAFIKNENAINQINTETVSGQQFKAAAKTLQKELINDIINKFNKDDNYNYKDGYAYKQLNSQTNLLTKLHDPKLDVSEKKQALKTYNAYSKGDDSGWKQFGKTIKSFINKGAQFFHIKLKLGVEGKTKLPNATFCEYAGQPHTNLISPGA
ncbi:hypothetical protein L3V82_10750 [Thiotrichales bacterium 19S3-7]|nr:hypothetical protein [Thiotrichales bacterium 19S3-7]MCF6802636.1 hypothetical protein [Thiotrichales bacterium 19S3-11]